MHGARRAAVLICYKPCPKRKCEHTASPTAWDDACRLGSALRLSTQIKGIQGSKHDSTWGACPEDSWKSASLDM